MAHTTCVGEPGFSTTNPPHIIVLFNKIANSNHQYLGSSMVQKKKKNIEKVSTIKLFNTQDKNTYIDHTNHLMHFLLRDVLDLSHRAIFFYF